MSAFRLLSIGLLLFAGVQINAQTSKQLASPIIDVHLHCYSSDQRWKERTPNPVTDKPLTATKQNNSGIFWRTKLNGTRVGHGGSDPGVQTEMLSNLSKDIGVILFMNTSMSDQDVLKYHFAIFRELFKHAEALKEKGR